MDTDPYAAAYSAVADVLMEYGGLVAPFMLGGEWDALSDFIEGVRQAPPTNASERREVEAKLNEFVESPAFHPNHRAHLVSRSLSLPHLSRCSHHLERAVLHYYKRDFLSCVLLLLPAVEGVLRSYVGWSFGTPNPKWQAVRQTIRAGVAETYPERRRVYADAICSFHERWFWTHTSTADFELSHLNRHYALHSLGTDSYYRAIDCHRLFLYFDTFADMLMYEGHGPKHPYLPLDEPACARRAAYYHRLVEDPPSVAEAMSIELDLMAEHPHFRPETSPPDRDQIVLRFGRVMGLDRIPLETVRRERQAGTPRFNKAVQLTSRAYRLAQNVAARFRRES